ncbi:shikimate dehydrogenase [Romboutsia ilealis]|uniref:shikimate dehydrogenase n=1 Tax=Romboutsia ilealis TaxID=1115758 RepID=UPI00257479AB|nr:shikimate dehydrogenase [Romboutsia ilealis]
MNINSDTKTICLLGHPIKHSFSPTIHNYLFEKYFENNIYVCFDIKEDKLKDCIYGIKALDIKGCNVTIPHKVNIIKYLDSIDDNAKLIGAVNTIKNKGGILKGYNTDGRGFVKSILDKGYDIKNKKVMIIGAGGACRSIAIELASEGVKYIEVRNRSLDRANEIIDSINNNFNTKANCSKDAINHSCLMDIDILINTTPIGMENDLCPIDTNIVIDKKLLVCDIVYKPKDTVFLNWAKRNNLEIIYGIDMLINQALESFYIWTGINPCDKDFEYIKKLYEKSV